MHQFPSRTVVEEILKDPGLYSGSAEKQACEQLIETLTEEEKEAAARTSYAYWVAVKIYDESPSNEIRMEMAMREARRHFVGQNGDFNVALESLRNTLQWRMEYKTDLLRVCFLDDLSGLKFFSSEEKEVIKKYKELLPDDLKKQSIAIRGHDKSNRAIAIKMGRCAPSAETNEESYRLAQIFAAEKALAITEIRSKGKEEQTIAVFDFSNYSYSNAPPTAVMVGAIKDMQSYYPERSYKLIICDPPFWMSAVFKIIKPFLSERTQGKVAMVSGENNKKEALESIVDAEQAMPFVLPEGKLKSEIDIHKVVSQPFHMLYDE